jgi:hypothetical protein
MTNISLAIQKAVEGGWHDEWQFNGYDPEYREKVYFQYFSGGELYDHDVLVSEAVLDPEFFKALGKSLGDKQPPPHPQEPIKCKDKNCWCGGKGMITPKKYNKWKERQHRLIDAIQQGRSIDEFFGEILKK